MPMNPNSPGTLGLEFPVLSQPATFLSDATPYCMSIEATASQTITNVRVKLGAGTFAGAALVVDVYAAEPSSSDFRTDLVYPNADDTFNGFTSGVPVDTVGNRYQNVDFWDISTTTIDSSAGIFGNVPAAYSAQFATLTLTLTGRRIESLLARSFHGHTVPEAAVTPYLEIDGTTYDALNVEHSAVDFRSGQFWTVRSSIWNFNPGSGAPWTITDITDFDGTDGIGVQNPQAPSVPTIELKAFEAQVTSCLETRVATGSFVPTAAGWQTVPLLTPAGGAFAISSGTTYYYVLRSLQQSNQQFNLATLKVDPASPVTCGFGEHLVILSNSQAGTVSDTIDETEASGTQAVTLEARRPLRHAIVPRTSSANATDAQPYSLLTAEAVETGSTMIQEITVPGSKTYSLLKIVVSQQNADSTSGDLLVKIKRRSDNVQVGSTVTITDDDITAPPTRARVLQSTFGTPAALTAQQYYLEFSSTASVGTGWYVYSLSDEDTTYDNRTFGGSTDIATIDGSDDSKKDFLATISEAPSAVTNFAAVSGTQSMASQGHSCSITNIGRVELSWTAVTLGAAFLRYEIERSDDGQVTWEQIAEIDTQAIVAFYDYEALRNRTSYYRIRVVNMSEAPSAWSSIVYAHPVMSDCGLLFVTNEEPAINLGLIDETPTEYEFLDAGRVVTYPLFGRDYQAAFKETEYRGDRFVRNLIVNAITEPAVEGRAVFDDLITLARAPTSYIAVLDNDGRRWYANVRVPSGIREEPGAMYTVPIEVIEVTGTPSAPPDGLS